MMSGTQFKQGDIVLVPVPFTDLSEAKQRPALIISNDNYNAKVEDIVVCGITSNIKDEDFSIVIDQKDMADGIMPFLSRIKADKLFSLNKNIISRRLGRVKKEVLNNVRKEILKLVE